LDECSTDLSIRDVHISGSQVELLHSAFMKGTKTLFLVLVLSSFIQFIVFTTIINSCPVERDTGTNFFKVPVGVTSSLSQ
jgi:hypothetical protein